MSEHPGMSAKILLWLNLLETSYDSGWPGQDLMMLQIELWSKLAGSIVLNLWETFPLAASWQ